jgi:signal transduction histidine kinase
MVDLSVLAEEIVIELRRTHPERVVQFFVEEGLMVRTDPALARLLLQNLLGNAWKFTAKRADARIDFTAVDCGGIRRFEVRDNGVGFWPSQAQHLFQPFRRLHNALEFPGTGLGLQGAKRIVERHGGTIDAEGAVGEGACFRFTLESPLSSRGKQAPGS